MNVRDLVIIVISAVCLVACKPRAMYAEYQSIPEEGWAEDSVFVFTVPVNDTVNTHDVIIHIRHTDEYPYQNMWLFVSENNRKDTIGFYLADEHGKWKGDGRTTIDMSVLFREKIRFTDSVYTICIQHGMREHVLLGVSDIGVEVTQ